MRRLGRHFFDRDAVTVARGLLGNVFVVGDGRRRIAGVIAETEAYTPNDPASHSFGGPTARNRTMFGPAGHLYVYLIYGIHCCANITTGAEGHGAAVLLRALRPLEGQAQMQRRRGPVRERDLANGPGKLCQALGIDRSWDGVDLCARTNKVRVEDWGYTPTHIAATPRIGISKAADVPWRFVIDD